MSLVHSHIDSRAAKASTAETAFAIALEEGLPRGDRPGGLAGVTGHIAESVAESMLVDAGWTPLTQFEGPFSGGHGVDLLMIDLATEQLAAVEVKGTLQERRWPRLSRGEVAQFSAAWLDKPDNVGMRELDLSSSSVIGLVVLLQFRRTEWRAVRTEDFITGSAVRSDAF